MKTSRRKFTAASIRGVSAVGLATAWTASQASEEDEKPFFKIFPIGKVEKEGQAVRLRLFDEYANGLLGLEGWSHVNVLYWFDKNDTPSKRGTLQVHPRGNEENPLTGVFACRAPVRPNLIALSVCKILSVEGNLVHVDGLDAFDATPILDLKPFIPSDAPSQGVRVPAWAKPDGGDSRSSAQP